MTGNESRHGGFGLHQIPNILTVLRMLAVAPLVWLLMQRHYSAALLLSFAAGASDAVDGYLAKRFSWTSRLGGLLDPLADKLLLVCCFVVLAWQGHVPLWLLALIIGRDVLIVAGGTAFHYLVAPVEAAPTRISKVNTFLQILLVLWVLIELSGVALPAKGHDGLVIGVAASTIASGIDYVWRWGRRAWQHFVGE